MAVIQLSRLNCKSGSVLRYWQTSTSPAGVTSIHGSIACRLEPEILSPNLPFRRSRRDWPAMSLDGKHCFLFERIVASGTRLGGTGLSHRADPIEIAPSPDISKADEQHGKEGPDIDHGDPCQLPCAFANRLLRPREIVATGDDACQRGRHLARNRRIAHS